MLPARVGGAGRPSRPLSPSSASSPHLSIRWTDGELLEWEGEAAADPASRADAAERRPRIRTERWRSGSSRSGSPTPTGFPSPAERSACSDTTSYARSSRWAQPNPDPLGLPDLALMVSSLIVAFDHHGTRSRSSPSPSPAARMGSSDAYERAVGRIEGPRASACGPRLPTGPASARPRDTCRPGRVRVEPDARAVRVERRPDRRVHPRRGCIPGGAVPALLGTRARWPRSRSTGASVPSIPPRTCTSWTSATSRSPAHPRSRW